MFKPFSIKNETNLFQLKMKLTLKKSKTYINGPPHDRRKNRR